MKSKISIYSIVFFLLFIFGCSITDTSNDKPAASTTNHTVILYNWVGAVQFTSLSLTPTDGSSGVINSSFVLSPSQTVNVNVKLPKTTAYKIEVFSASGKRVFWNSIVMDSNNGTTRVTLGNAQNMTFCANSSISGSMKPDGCEL